MDPTVPEFIVPLMLVGACLALLAAPSMAGEPDQERGGTAALPAAGLLIAVSMWGAHPVLASASLALVSLLHAWRVLPRSRDAALMFALAGLASGTVAAALELGLMEVAFVASFLAISLRAGLIPLHGGVARLCERDPAEQVRQLGSLIPLVFVHLRFVDHDPIAFAAATPLVWVGTVAALIGAATTLVAEDLRGFFRGATVTHGGILAVAVAASGLGEYAAALFHAITMAVAMGGLGVVVTALEERAGRVQLAGLGGRATAFPLLASAFLVFGLAGVAAPGTAGFIADDLLLHTISQVSMVSAGLLLVASATLAIATLRVFASIFLGKPTTSAAPDLELRERLVVAALFTTTVVLGFVPRALTDPADQLLGHLP
jgi:NADH-quinone oxidoreductase subunit M